MDLEIINIFLYEKELAAIHYIIIGIIIGVASTLTIKVLGSLIKIIWFVILHKIINPFFNFIQAFNRIFIRQNLTLGEYKKILLRLKNGGELKWYEKKAYENARQTLKSININNGIGGDFFEEQD